MSDPPNFEGHSPDIEHRTVGPHRAWSFTSTEWCYPESPCAHCEQWLAEKAEQVLWGSDQPGYGRIYIPDINPEPWTAPEVSIGRRGGKLAPTVYKREHVRSFQEAVIEFLEHQELQPTELELKLQFWFWRQLDTPRSKLADATNLQKSTEDALHGHVFVNDRQVQEVHTVIVQQDIDVRPGILVVWSPYQGLSDDTPLRIRQSFQELIDEASGDKKSNTIDIEPEALF